MGKVPRIRRTRTGARICAILFAALIAEAALATCPPQAFTDPGRVRLSGDAVMIVTHATSVYDARFSTKRGVDEATRFAKRKRIPLVYLQEDSPEDTYFAADCTPDYRVFAMNGEVRFDLPTSHVYVAGGHLEWCLSYTLHDVLAAWARQPKRNLTVTYLMDAIYSNGKSIEDGDQYFQDFRNFMGVVTYGRPGGEHWPKLTLLETLGIISREDREYDYLERVLPHYARTLPSDYQVEMQLNDSASRILQHAKVRNAPVLRFRFVDSALALTDKETFPASGTGE